MRKVLLLNVNRDGWHSGNMVYDMMAIQSGAETKTYGPGWAGYDTTDLPTIIKKLYGDDKPDVIYSYFTESERVGDVYMHHYNIPESLRHFPQNMDKVKGVTKIFGLSDFWARMPQRYKKDLSRSDFDYCFCCFTPPFSSEKDFYSFFDKSVCNRMEFISHPRCIDPECYKDYGLQKQYDVITVGAMWNFYKFRGYMHNVLSQKHKGMGIRYKNYSHCGINYTHNGFVRERYAQAINQSHMLVSCGGRYHLAFNKIFESMACRTLYVGEKPYGEKELHMEDGVNYVAVTPDNFIDKIKYYLEHPEEMEFIKENGMKMCKKYHTIDARAKDFAKLLEDIL
jgi:hypothetical protein